MCDFMFYQFYEQPYVGGDVRYQTPTGYSNRTANGMRSLQDTPWSKMALATMYRECRPMAWSWKFNKNYIPASIEELGRETMKALTAIPTVPEYEDVPPEWSASEPWPEMTPYTSPLKEWHSILRSTIDTKTYQHVNHQAWDTTYSRTFPTTTEATDDLLNREQWWARRAGSAGNGFAYFIEGTAFSGNYGGFYSGKIEAFWRENQGPVVLSLRESRGSYGWSQVELWRADQVWGRDENDKAFSWSKLNGNKHSEASEARDVSWDEEAQRFTVVTPMAARGQESENVLSGELTLTKRFTALPNGLKIDTEIRSDEVDEVKELWLTIPLYEGGIEAENKMPYDFTVDIWRENDWVVLSSASETTTRVRIGHRWGQDYIYSIITLDSQRSLRLLPADTELDFHRIHLLQIDLHGNPGRIKSMPGFTSLTCEITAN
jgi:hypothetical protein